MALSLVTAKGSHSCDLAPSSALVSSSRLFLPTCLAFPNRLVSRTRRHVLCMAHPRRVKMVAQQIRREVGDMLIKDKVLQHAIFPEAALGADMYLSSLATVSDVVLSKDLQVAKVYVSICSDERGKEVVMEGLKAKTKYVRAGLGKRMQLRLTPEVRFILDESLEKASRVISILDKLRKEREEAEGKDDEDDDNWDEILDDNDEIDNAKATRSRKAISEGEDDDITDYQDDENIVLIR